MKTMTVIRCSRTGVIAQAGAQHSRWPQTRAGDTSAGARKLQKVGGHVAAAHTRMWTINGDFLLLQPSGIARYAREVTTALDQLLAEGHPLTAGLQLDLIVPRAGGNLPLRHIPARIVPEFTRPRLPQFWVQAQLPFHVRGGLVSFCNLAPIWHRRHIVCIHDLNVRLTPESYAPLFRIAHRSILPLLGRRARLITTVSELSRDSLIRFGFAPAHKTVVTYNGSDHTARWDANRSMLDLDGCRPFVLWLGSSLKHKNPELLRRIANSLDEAGVHVLIAGSADASAVSAFGSEKPPNFRLLGRISDDDFARALSKALCFLFPSRVEGFGLPAVEAMARGCPVVASRASCLPEICGDAALYAGPDDAEAWVGAIGALRSNANLRRDLISKGITRAANYSWRSIAELYVALMARVDGEDGHFLHAETVAACNSRLAAMSEVHMRRDAE